MLLLLWAPLGIVGLLTLAGLTWARAWGPPQPAWKLTDVFGAFVFFVGAAGVSGTAVSAIWTGSWVPEPGQLLPGVVGTAHASALVTALVVCRAQLRPLGVCRPDRWAWGAAAAGVPLFLALSASWAWLVEMSGWGFEPQLLLRSLADVGPREQAAMLVYGAVGAPLVEELIFRGFLLPPLIRRCGGQTAVWIAGVVFGVVHMTDPVAVPPLIALGVGLSWLRWRCQSVWPGIAVHVANNSVALTVSLAALPTGA